MFFPISYLEKLQPGKYQLSRISTSRNINSKNCKIQFFSLFGWFFKNFALKIYGVLKMFLLSAQNNFYIVSSSYVEGHVKKKSSLNFMSLVGFQAPKFWMFFWKIFVELVPQFSCKSWLVGFWVNRHSKMQKNSANNFLHFWAAIMDLLITLKLIFAFSNVIHRGVSSCKI